MAPSYSNLQNFFAKRWDPNFLDALWNVQIYRKRQTTPRWPRTCSLSWQRVTISLSLKGTSFQHDRFQYVALSRHLSFAVVVDFVCVFRCSRPQTHGFVCLVQETSNTTFPSTNTLFDKTVCVWIVGSSCGVKDCVFSNRQLRPQASRPSSLWIRQTPRNNHCILIIASLIVSLRLFANTSRTETCLSVRSATNKYSDPTVGNWQSSPSLIHPADDVVVLSSSWTCMSNKLQMSSAQMFDVHVIYATVTSINRARREQSRENTLLFAADEVIQTT